MTVRFGSLTKVGPSTYKDENNLVTITATVVENDVNNPFSINDETQPILSKRTITIQLDCCLEDGRQLPLLQVGLKYKAITSELIGGNNIVVANPPITYPGQNGERIAFDSTDLKDTLLAAVDIMLNDFGV